MKPKLYTIDVQICNTAYVLFEDLFNQLVDIYDYNIRKDKGLEPYLIRLLEIGILYHSEYTEYSWKSK